MTIQSVTKRRFSASTSARGIKVVGTATGSATTIHTAVAGTAEDGPFDEIFAYAYNGHTAAVLLTLEIGGATVPDDVNSITLQPKQGKVLLLDGDLLQGGLALKAFASVANVVAIRGFVNRISAPA